jgi:hypothetical protein
VSKRNIDVFKPKAIDKAKDVEASEDDETEPKKED